MVEAIESAMATAYKREYGKRGQMIRAKIDLNTGTIAFEQVKTVVDDTTVRFPAPDEETEEELHAHQHPFHQEEEHLAEGELPRFDSEKHILLADAKLIKRGAELGEAMLRFLAGYIYFNQYVYGFILFLTSFLYFIEKNSTKQ